MSGDFPYVRQALTFLFWLLAVQAGSAHPFPDTSCILKYPDQLHVSTGLQTNNSDIVLTTLATEQLLRLSPRRSLQQFVKAEYRGMAFKYAISPGYLNPDVSAITGKTTRRSLGYSFGLGPFGLSASYEKSKGYYLENTAEFDPAWRPGQPYIQFSNLRSVLYGLQFSYNVRQAFSEAAVNSCRERQRKPNYTFIPTLGLNHITYINDATATDTISGATRYLDCNAKLLAGGSLPLFRQRLQLSAIAGPMVGIGLVRDWSYDLQRHRNLDNRTTVLSLGFLYNIGLSYNARHWFAGINAFSEQYGSKLTGNLLIKNFYGIELYTGLRFREPELLKSVTDRVFQLLDKYNPLK